MNESLPIHVKIVCPQSLVAEEQASRVEIPASLGVRLILPEQAPLFCALKEGLVVLYRDGGVPLTYLISRGVCEVRSNVCSILAWACRLDQMSYADVTQQLTQAENQLKTTHSAMAKKEILTRMEFFRVALRELEKVSHKMKPLN